MFLAVKNQGSTDPATHEGFYLQGSLEVIINALNDPSSPDITFYKIVTTTGVAVLHKVTLKTTARISAGSLETAIARAGGKDIGSAIVTV